MKLINHITILIIKGITLINACSLLFIKKMFSLNWMQLAFPDIIWSVVQVLGFCFSLCFCLAFTVMFETWRQLCYFWIWIWLWITIVHVRVKWRSILSASLYFMSVVCHPIFFITNGWKINKKGHPEKY